MPEPEAAARIRRILERVRALALVRGARGVEQTPETAFVLEAALHAYPQARAVHVVRDGRDVVCSLLERGWLSADRTGGDDARLSYGAEARFWVEPERRVDFESAGDAARAAWAWNAYVTAARSVRERVLEVRYEALVESAPRIAEHLGIDHGPLEQSLGSFTIVRSAASGATSRPSSWQMSNALRDRSCTSSATTERRRPASVSDTGSPARHRPAATSV